MTTYAGPPVFPPYFVDVSGDPEAAASITVYNRGTTTKSTVYTDRLKTTGGTVAPYNPVIADSLGNAVFFCNPGQYDALVNGVTFPFTVVADAGDVQAPIPPGTYAGVPTPGTAATAVTFVPGLQLGTGAGKDVANDATLAAAIAAAPVGSTLRLPWGLIQFTTLPSAKSITIEGEGSWNKSQALFGNAQWSLANYGTNYGGTVLACTATTGVAVNLTDPAGVIQANLRHLMVLGPGSGSSTGIRHGAAIGLGSVGRCGLEKVCIANFSIGCDLYCEEGEYSTLNVWGCQTGIRNFGNNCHHSATGAQACSVSGIEDSAAVTVYDAPLLQANTGKGMILSGTGTEVDRPYCENPSGTGAIEILAAGSKIAVVGFHGSSVADTITCYGGANYFLFPEADKGLNCVGVSNVAIGHFAVAPSMNGGIYLPFGDGVWDIAGRDMRIASGKKFYFETSGTGSYIGRDTGTGDTVIGAGSYIVRCRTDGCFRTGSGATGARPALGTGDVGSIFFDTTLGKLITWSGTAWVVPA